MNNVIAFPKTTKINYETICGEKTNKIVIPIEITDKEGFLETYLLEIYAPINTTISLEKVQNIYNSAGMQSIKQFIKKLNKMGFSVRLIEYPILLFYD